MMLLNGCRVVLLATVVHVTLPSGPLLADPIRGPLPADGHWVTYELTFMDIENPDISASYNVTVRMVGSAHRDGEACRLIEVDVSPKNNVGDQSRLHGYNNIRPFVAKLLIRAAGAEQSDERLTIHEGVIRVGDTEPEAIDLNHESLPARRGIVQFFLLLDELLRQSDPEPASLVEPILAFDGIRRSGSEEVQKWLTVDADSPPVAIRERIEQQIDGPKGAVEGISANIAVHNGGFRLDFELAESIPFGIHSIRFVLRFPERLFVKNSPLVDLLQWELRAVDYGDGAESVLPDVN